MRFDVPYAENKNYGRATSNCQVRKGPTDMDDACSDSREKLGPLTHIYLQLSQKRH